MMAFTRVLAMALALASSSAWSSHPSKSARNQYEAREDRPQPPQLLTEATDRPEVHRFDLSNKSPSEKSVDSDLQVGCGEGFIHEELQDNKETDKNKPRKHRRKRSYTAWSGQVSYSVPYQSIAVWKPPLYQLSRPYYIPIFGVAGRPPIYFPPQPLLINSGVPKDNPDRRYEAPQYLPPQETTTERRFQGPQYLPPEETTMMNLQNRFNGGDSDDDRPIWDVGGENEMTQRPATTTAIIPTRKTRRPGVPKTLPPLIHTPTDGQDGSNAPSPNVETEFSPPAAQLPKENPILASTSRPNEPSRCVWAIISCCSTSNQISYDCFEQRGCPGAFWDSNPCDSDFAKAAIAAALNYYEKK